MSTSIEQRVVQMRFDNKQFESGVAQSMSTLDKFEQKLKFKDATKGFDDISRAADQVSLNNLMNQADGLGQKFDAMAVVAISALNRITNAAITTGTNLVKSLSTDQIFAGFNKYEARTAAVQTLVNATGKSVEDIEKYMDKLMLYSDETSYGFADMTSSLSTMVSAGGDINKLVPLLEGFGNAVSFVGKGAAEYSRAVIQLSQGYGRNALMLEDWKSIEQTLGGAKQLKQVFIEVGEELGKIKKGNIDIGKFNESLKDKWLDQEVMEVALGRFGEMTERAFAMIEAGEAETVSEAYQILSETVDDYRIKAAKAAQEAKSFTEAIDATKDAVSTKWMESFQIIFGNYEEATELWTELTNTLWELFAASGDVRNEILRAWKEFGGRDQAILAVKAAFEALIKPMSAVKEAIDDIFFPGSEQEKGFWLYKATYNLREFFEAITLSDKAVGNLKTAFKALLLPVFAFVQAIRVGIVITKEIIVTLAMLTNKLLELPSKLNNVENPFKRIFGDERYARLAESMTTIVDKLGKAFGTIGSKITNVGKSIATTFSTKTSGSISRLLEALKPIGEWILDRIVDGFELLASFDYSKISDWAVSAIDSLVIGFGLITSGCTTAIGAIKNFFASFKDMSALEVIDAIIKGVASMKTNMAAFIKSLGFDQIMKALKEEAGSVADVIANLGEAVQTLISKLTPAKILVFSFGVSLVWVFTNLAKAIAAFQAIAQGVTGVLGGITGVLKAFQSRLKGSPILQIALAIGVLAIALGALSQIDPDRLWAAAGSLSAVMGALLILTASMAAVTKFLINSEQMAKNFLLISQSMLMMAGSVAILVAALWGLSKVDMDGIIGKLFALATMMGMLVAAIKLTSKGAAKQFTDSLYILTFAASLNLMVSALAKIGSANLSGSISNLAAMAIVIGMMVAIAKMSKGIKLSSGVGMLLMVGTLLIFVKALKPIANADLGTLVTALINFIPIFLLLKLMFSSVGDGKQALKAGAGITAMSAGILIMYFAIKSLGQLDTSVLIKGVAAVGAIMLFVAAMEAITKTKIWENEGSTLKASFLALSVAILLLGVAINYIGGLELKRVVQGTVVVGALMTFITLLAKAVSPAEKAMGTVIAMTVCIGLVMSALALLTLLDFNELIRSASVMAVAFVSLAIMFKSMSNIKTESAIASILSMLAAISMIGLTLKYLAEIPNPDAIIPAAAGIGVVLLAIGGSFALLQQNKIFETASLQKIGKTLLLMAGMIVTAGSVLWVLSNVVTNTEDLIFKATSLGIILLALGKSMSLFNVKTAGIKNMGKTAGLMLAMGIIATGIVFLLSLIENPEGLVTKALGFSVVLLAMTGAIALLSVVSKGLEGLGKAGADAIGGAAVAEVIIITIAGLILLIGAVFNHFSDTLDPALTKAEEVIPRLGAVIGSFIGSIYGGVIEAVGGAIGSTIEAFGISLSNFAENVQGFLTLKVDQEVVDSIGRLALVAITIAGAEFLEAIMTFGKGNSLETFGQQLASFAPHFVDFANQLAQITNLEAVSTSATCLEALGTVLANIPTDGGVMGMIFGKKDISGFGQGLTDLANGVADYASILSDSDINTETVEATSQLTSMLVNMANKLPNTGGLVDWLVGKKDLGEFGSQLVVFANGIRSFLIKIGLIDIDSDKVKSVTSIADMLIGLTNKLPATDGLLEWIVGKKNLGTFTDQLVIFADGMGRFFTHIAYISVDQTKVDAIKLAADTLVELADSVPRSGALIDFFGAKDIGKFGEQIGQFGSGIGSFFSSITDVGLDQGMVDLAKNAGLAFAEISDAIGPNTGMSTWWESTNLETFGTQVKGLGDGLAGFYEATAEVSWADVSSAITQLKRIVELAPSMESIGSDQTYNFKVYLNELANTGVTEFTSTFINSEQIIQDTIYNTISNAIASARVTMTSNPTSYAFIIDTIVYGITSNQAKLIEKTRSLVPLMRSTLSSELNSIRAIGSFVITAIIQAFENGKDDLKLSVQRVLSVALQSAKDTLRITNRYSEEFYAIGQYTIDGYINGLAAQSGRLYSKLTEIGNASVATFEKSVGVASPSVKYAEIGMYTMLGLIKGINDNAGSVNKTMVKIGADLINSIQNYLGINSPSKVARDEVGRYIVQGIAEGITSDMSAEDAAAKKAQNIISAFQTELNKWSIDTNTADLEYRLWSTLNPNATDNEIRAKQLDMLDKKLSYQAERVNAANAQYQATLQALGEGATQTREAYNTFLQEQITMAELASQMVDANTVVADEYEQWEKQITRQYQNQQYIEIYKQVKDQMLEEGKTLDEIQAYAKEKSGWTPLTAEDRPADAGQSITDTINKYMSEATGSIEGMANNIEVIIQQSSEAANQAAKQVGSGISSNIASGISENSSAIKNAVKNSLPGKEEGENTGKGFIDGIRDSIKGAGDAATGLAEGAGNAIRSALGINSPSTVTYQYGVYTVQGLANGISETSGMAENASAALAQAAYNPIEGSIGQWTNAGSQMCAGLASGISSGSSIVTGAAQAVASAAISAAMATLGIHSPSREYYDIGEMMDQGLANGIIDNASVVKTAVQKMLSKAQKGLEADGLYITPVVESPKQSAGTYSSRGYNYADLPSFLKKQNAWESELLLQWDALGNLVPTGFRNAGGNLDEARWWIAPSQEIADQIRYLGDQEAERAAYENANKGVYEGTMKELKQAVQEMSSQPSSINMTQNNYSPEALSSSTIYRQTNTALSKASAAASPTKQSLTSIKPSEPNAYQ